MQAKHTVIYRLRGLSARVADPARDILPELGETVRVRLTQDPTDQAASAWRRLALGNVLLNGMVGRRGEGEVEALIEAELEKELEATRLRFGRGPYLVFSREGEVEDFDCPHERAGESFDLGLDGPAPTLFSNASVPLLRDILAALSLHVIEFSGYDELVNAVTYSRADGRPFFVFHPHARASAEVGHAIPDSVWDGLGPIVAMVEGHTELDSAFRLLRTSLERHGDRLRAFLAAWFGLEILVGKTFGRYEAAFFQRIVSHTGEEGGELPHVDRIREVMKDKYRLADRFSLMATELRSTDVDQDVEEFRKAKAVRDDLLHGKDIPDSALPLEAVHALLRRYLDLHLRRVLEED